MGGDGKGLMTFGGHLDVLRGMLFRMACVVAVCGVAVFCCKDVTFRLLLAPSQWNFATYRWIEDICRLIGVNFHFEEYHVRLISTELSAQFMTHLSTSVYLALLLASPYMVYELFRFVSPALYENERRYSFRVAAAVYLLFLAGVLMSYFIVFPVSFRFLGTYQVSADIENQITLSSYVSTFTTLTFLMGLVFQVPVIVFFLAKLGILSVRLMRRYRRHAVLIILVISAIITPPDVFTLLLVALPICLLYEAGILIAARVERGR